MGRRLRDERGFTIIEVLASALLVVVVSLGVMSAMDTTSRASDNSRARSIAQSLAQQDQERMRGMTVAQLMALPGGPQAKTVDGRDFQLTSTAVWDGDPDPNPDCGGDPVTTDYIRVTSMVSWADIRVAPIVNRSLIAAPSNGAGGKIIVQVQNRLNQPAPGYNVSLSPAGVRSDGTTSNKGCVAWDGVPAGTYTVTVSRAGGYVDKNGKEAYSQDVNVLDNKAVSVGPVTFDRAATVKATFQTTIGAFTYNSPSYAKTDRITAMQAGLAAPRRFGTPGTAVDSITTQNDDGHPTSPGLFPFTSAYGIYAGDCTAEDPTNYGATIADTVTLAPGDVDKPLVVRMPPVETTVRYTSSTPLDGANVIFTSRSTACGNTPINLGATGPDPADATRHGRLQFPAVPWGDYDVCAEYFNPTPVGSIAAGWYTTTLSNVQVRAAGRTGGSALVLDFATSAAGPGVRC
jgi:type II secretory pathway pseudopilin PulG